jgi:NitT/TauT family transport system substrate-binding protein
MQKLTGLSKWLMVLIGVGSAAAAVRTHGKTFAHWNEQRGAEAQKAPDLSPEQLPNANPVAATQAVAAAKLPAIGSRPIRIAISQWPGHMAFVLGAGGLRTQPGSIAAREGLDLEIVFIEDAPSKNKALQNGDVDFVWETVDELPIALGGYRAAHVDVRAFVQIDWSRGGDACVSSREVQKVEDIVGRKSAVLLFSPDHTVFEFMITNSRLTPQQVQDARKNTQFSPDDFTFARKLFADGKIDVACLWEPDVTLALAARPGSHRLFSTADATELVADVLIARQDLLESHPDIAEKVARVQFQAAAEGNRDKPAAARLISTAAPRFRDELGYEPTLKALEWAKWTELPDNVRFFGLDGTPPAFDRVYNQADSIWINYPEAEIKDRFAPVALRNDHIVRRIWEGSGKPAARAAEIFDSTVAKTGTPIFTKPVSLAFATGSSELDPQAIAVVNQQILPQLQIAGGMYARVEGNTDSQGEPDANQQLSLRRAFAIVEYLVSRGVPRDRMVARGNGEAIPVASNKTAEGRALNRRTDVLFIRAPH